MRKILLLLHTVRYLKPKQLWYQVYYRFKSFLLPYLSYQRYSKYNLYPLDVEAKELIVSRGKYVATNTFTFLNLSKKFDEKIDWNFMEYGKLWNYNLQYFDYLQDGDMADKEKQRLIEDFCGELMEKKIQPEPYPVSLRLINFILYHSTSGYTSPAFKRALTYQIDYLESNLEYHILANHLLENYFALFVSGFVLKDKKLTVKSLKWIEEELEEQVLKDGGHYECSPMYHSILLSKLLLILDILNKNKWIELDDKTLRTKAEKMLSWLSTFSFRDGSLAHFNDSIDGIAPDKELINYGRRLGLKVEQVQLKESGYRKYVFDDYEALVDVGNIIPGYQPGHVHSDMLSFCINTKNGPFLVDAGISTYEKNEIRQRERSSFFHNTVTIGRENQSEVWSGFRVGKRARLFIAEDEVFKLKGMHDGYKQKHKCLHEREFVFSDNKIVIADRLTNSTVTGTAFFYFHHSLSKPRKQGDAYIFDKVAGLQFGNSLKEEISDYQKPVEYNRREKAFCLEVQFKGNLNTTIQL